MPNLLQNVIRILVVDNDEMVRQTLADYLCAIQGFEVVGAAGNGREAVELAAALLPEVVVTEMEMPVMDGVEATRQITRLLPGTAVILLSDFGDLGAVRAGLDAGALCSVRKGDPIVELSDAIARYGRRRLAQAKI
jgi:DNA-binding NarL/FixJ family response regulator